MCARTGFPARWTVPGRCPDGRASACRRFCMRRFSASSAAEVCQVCVAGPIPPAAWIGRSGPGRHEGRTAEGLRTESEHLTPGWLASWLLNRPGAARERRKSLTARVQLRFRGGALFFLPLPHGPQPALSLTAESPPVPSPQPTVPRPPAAPPHLARPRIARRPTASPRPSQLGP